MTEWNNVQQSLACSLWIKIVLIRVTIVLTPVDTLSNWCDLHPDVSEKQRRLYIRQVCPLKFTMDREMTRGGIYFRYIPAPGNRQFFHFPVAIKGRGACDIRPSAFTSFQLCRLVLPARLSVILRTRLSVHSFSPFVSHASSRCFHPFRLPAFSFFSSTTSFLFNRYYAIPALDREKFRATQQSVRFFYWLLSRASATPNEPFPFTTSYFSGHSFHSSPRGRQQRTTERRQQGFCDHVSYS